MSYRDPEHSESSWQDDEYRDLLAGEYVLGTLEERELAQLIERLPFDSDLRYRVQLWEERLQPLANAMEPIEPPAYVWRKIVGSITRATTRHRELVEDELRHSRRKQVSQHRNQLARWRLATAVACAASIGAFSLLWLQQATKPATFDAISVVSGDGDALWVVDASIDSTVLKITAIKPPEIASNQVYELWMVKPDDGGVVSLGLLPNDVHTSTTIEHSAIDASAIALAVSLEPTGGSTESAPTGPVLYEGEFSLIEASTQ